VFCYDGDLAGKKAAWRALENTLPVIRDGKVARFLFLPEKEDPDTMVRKEGSEAFETRIKNATTLSDFLFDHLTSQVDITTREGKAQLASKANALIQKMHNSLYKDLLIEELSNLVGLSQQHLEAKITDSTATRKPASLKAKPARRQGVSQQVANNITRLAVALLIQNPELASQCPAPESFSHSTNKGLPLLFKLQQTILSSQGISSAALIERFRGAEHENAVNALSILQTPETENRTNIFEEYKNIVQRLVIDDRYEFLTHKYESGAKLDNEEMREFVELSHKKH
jgi:DNA primase